jgi:hypothetical protein
LSGSDFPFIRALSEPSDGSPYVVGAMMTPNLTRYGDRLAGSCRAHGQPLALFEVPAVHRSISRKGSDDLRGTKACFINFLLDRYGCPVLYIDVDCCIVQHPERVQTLLTGGIDFAVFNWLAEEHTETYVPVEVPHQDGTMPGIVRNRFYRFSHSVDHSSDTQLFSSGMVQWYGNTQAARGLLASWQEVIRVASDSPDDKCLDFAFNNYPAGALKVAWLEKRYARYGWWIYERPVIDHPQRPYAGDGFAPLDALNGKRRIYPELLKRRDVEPVFPKDCLIDTESRRLLRLHGREWREAGRITIPLWLETPSGA